MAGIDNDVIYGTNFDFSGAGGGQGGNATMLLDGQILIGSTALNAGGTHCNIARLTEGTGVTITNGPGTITISLTGGGVAVEHLTGNSGGQLNPDGSNNFTIITANTTVKFAGSGSTLTQDFSLSNIVLGSSLPVLTSGTMNVGMGYLSLNSVTTGHDNTCIGYASCNVMSTGILNTLIGSTTGGRLTTGSSNTGVGYDSLNFVITGSNNTCLGLAAGSAYASSESSNICIGNAGIAAESNKIRIGISGSAAGQQNACYIAGIDGVNVGSVAKVVTLASDQLGTATLTNGTGISITPGANTITINSTGGISWAVITADQTAAVNNGYICNKGSALLLTLPATAAIGDTIRVTGISTALGWKIVQAANQQIFFGNTSTTLGATGFLQSAAIRDSVEMVVVVAGASTVWNVLSSVGNITVA